MSRLGAGVALSMLALLMSYSSAFAAEVAADPSNYRARLRELRPGDQLRLAAGRYDGLVIQNLNGEEGRSIVISGPESGPRAIITGASGRNTISIRDSSYVVVRDLEVDNQGASVDAIKAEGDASFAHHITLERLHLHNFGADQQLVGINTKCPTWDWTIRYNLIERAGTGLYLGNSDGNQPFVRGLIEFNLIVDTIGYNMQIKHQNQRPALDGAGAVTIIRHNVFIKSRGASTGGDARPNLLVGHQPLSGPGQNDRFEIYGNFFFQNQSGTEALFQGEGHLAFHDNILVNTFGAGINIRPHNDVPKNVAVYHNTVYTTGLGIGVTGGAPQFGQVVAGNAVFSPSPMNGGELTDNVTDALGSALGYVHAANDQLGMMDFYPLPGSLEGSPVDLSAFTAHADYDRDFNGTVKSRTTRGAYSGGAAQNPGWLLAQEIKTLAQISPPRPDGGSSPDTSVGPDVPIEGAPDAGGIDENRDAGDPGSAARDLRGGCACSSAGERKTAMSAVWAAALALFAILGSVRRRLLAFASKLAS